MEIWLLILLFAFVIAIFKPILNLPFLTRTSGHRLPPGPPTFPIIGNFLWLIKSTTDLESILRSLHSKLGPVVTLHFGSQPTIFVADRFLTHHALVHNSSTFADRPPPVGIEKINSCGQHTVNSASYGPNWRLLRRNLTAEILHPSRVKSYSHARKRVLEILKKRLESEYRDGGGRVKVMGHFQYTMFSLLVLMCFGDKVDEDQIKKIEGAQRSLLLGFNRFNILGLWPRLTKIIFRNLWEEYMEIRRNQEKILIPLIRAREEMKEKVNEVVCYADTLMDLVLPEEKRKLKAEEMVSLCSEFLNAGTDTTSTALQWVMANLVKYPQIQDKLFMEIKGVVGDREAEELIKEDDLQKMPYLKAMILEGLRRHPPAHFVLPHAVTEDTSLGQYLIPKNGTINFMAAEIGWDPKVWEDPMAFKPERFLGSEKGDEQVFDITGSKEVKMMPFGVGRRICPGYGLAMLHLEYFVANLVWSYEWKAMEGDEVDLTEQEEFTVVMKYPLQALVFPRSRQCSVD